jgi:hypothetical protein
MKTTINKVRRSRAYYLMIPILHGNEARNAHLDTLGAAVVVGLLLGIVSLMRMILAA